MRKILTSILLILISNLAVAQSPQGIPYQAIARNSSGVILANQAIRVRFSIHDSVAAGTLVYRETFTPTTTAQGLFNVQVGTGTATTGTFSSINWGHNAKFMQVEMDPAGGTSYVDMGTQQMMSVPYALYSNNGMPSGQAVGDMLYWNGTSWTRLPAGTEGSFLKTQGGSPAWSQNYSLPVVTLEVAPLGTNIYQGYVNISNGGSPIISSGICWDTLPNPNDSLSPKSVFTSHYPGIPHPLLGFDKRVYYFRAYATNSVGTGYSNQIEYSTGAPWADTFPLSGVTDTTAMISGQAIFIYPSADSLINKGFCWDTNHNPTIDLATKTVNGPGVGIFTANIPSLSPGTTYYIRAYATNAYGTMYGTESEFTTSSPGILQIGQLYQGGILAYLLQPGDPGYSPTIPHGLIVAPTESSAIGWGCESTLTGGTSSSFGSGPSNTAWLVSHCGTGTAAYLCDTLTIGGYSDWYLPSVAELHKLMFNSSFLGMYSLSAYWTSTESSESTAVKVYFSGMDAPSKSEAVLVRAVRSF